MHAGQVAMTQDAGVGMCCLQPPEQCEQCLLLSSGARVGAAALRIEASLVAHAERVLVVARGVCPFQMFVSRLVALPVARDIVVIARVSEAFGMAAYECHDGKGLVGACGRAVHHDQVNVSH